MLLNRCLRESLLVLETRAITTSGSGSVDVVIWVVRLLVRSSSFLEVLIFVVRLLGKRKRILIKVYRLDVVGRYDRVIGWLFHFIPECSRCSLNFDVFLQKKVGA